MCTDMCVHDSWTEKWQTEFGDGPSLSISTAEDPDDISPRWVQKVLLCQGIIKCADISNPTRPYEITLEWSSALIHEWISQAYLERLLDIPVTALSPATPFTEAQSQVGFMKRFALPLFELVGSCVMPFMREYTKTCRENLEIWENRKMRFSGDDYSSEREERQEELNRLEARSPTEYTGVFALCVPERFSFILPKESIGYSDSQSDSADTFISTPASPRSPVSSPSSELTPPSSPTSSASASSSLFSPRRRLQSNTSSSGTSIQSQPLVKANGKMGLRIVPDSTTAGGGHPRYRHCCWRKASTGAWRNPELSAVSSDTSPQMSSASTILHSPFTPLTSPPPASPPIKPMNYRRALTKAPSTSCLAKSPRPLLSSYKSTASLKASPSVSSPKQSSPASPVTKSKQSPTTTKSTIVVSPPTRRGLFGNRAARS